VVGINEDNAPELNRDPHYKALRYKGSLYADRQEVDAAAIKAMLDQPGEMVIVDDPRGVLVALGRKLSRPSLEQVKVERRSPAPPSAQPDRTERELLAVLLDDADWNSVPKAPQERKAKAESIRRRAGAAEEIRRRRLASPEVESALIRRV